MSPPGGETNSLSRLAHSLSFHRTTSRDFIKEDARKAVHLAVNKAFQTAIMKDGSPSSDGGILSSSADLSSESYSSTHSHEQAMRRGSSLAEVEMGESGRRQLFLDDHDGTQDARTGTTALSGSASKSSIWSRRKKKTKSKCEKLKESEAWMCGVCARRFSSFEAAELHEDYHIKEVLVDLGWGTEHADVSSIFSNNGSPSGRPKTPERRHSASQQENTKRQPRPDILRMSSPLTPSSRASVQPYTPTIQRKKIPPIRKYSDDSYSNHEEDPEFKLATSLAVPHMLTPIFENDNNRRLTEHVDECGPAPLLLVDEALVDVCRKAESLGLLTADEKDAEFGIECLAKEKAYYDILFKRAAQRKQDGTYRFRSEGKTAICKVQNKFVDAYQLMKEGKTKRGSTTLDYYTRKLKGNAEEGLAMDHSKDTLYVNVMVKNSIKVVRHELERLAKRRWEDSQNGKEETDIQRKRFQKFRAAAQDNLVKLAGYALAADFTPRRVR